MSYYVIIRGPAAGGKTTIAKLLSNKLQAHYISFDEIRVNHKIGLSESDRIKANNIAIPEAKQFLEKGTTVIFDGVFYHKSQLEHLEKHLPHKHFTFSLTATVDECKKRHEHRESEISENSVKAVHRLVSEFDCGIEIDTMGDAPEDTLKKIMDHLK